MAIARAKNNFKITRKCNQIKNMPNPSNITRLQIRIHGAVQGVGFRPFVYRLARSLGLAGEVKNSSQGVVIDAEGPEAVLRDFLLRLERENPPRSFIHGLETVYLDPVCLSNFTVGASEKSGGKSAWMLPDIAAGPAS